MAFWSSKPKSPAPLHPWEYAKEVSRAEAERGDLPVGWYIYRDGYVWYGLKPNDNQDGLQRSFHRPSPEDLEDWLGVPIPKPQEPLLSPQAFSTVTDTTETNSPILEPPGTPEEESSTIGGASAVKPPQKRATGRVRCNEMHFFFSDSELAQFRRRVLQSGLNQSAFIRKATLTGRIVVEEVHPETIELLDDIAALRAELGRQGGMLKMVIKPNMGQRELAPDEWAALVAAIRYLERTAEQLDQLKERLNGSIEAQDQ